MSLRKVVSGEKSEPLAIFVKISPQIIVANPCCCHNQASEDVLKHLQAMKTILYGTENHEPNAEIVAQLSQEAYNNNLFGKMIKFLPLIDFEVRFGTT